ADTDRRAAALTDRPDPAWCREAGSSVALRVSVEELLRPRHALVAGAVAADRLLLDVDQVVGDDHGLERCGHRPDDPDVLVVHGEDLSAEPEAGLVVRCSGELVVQLLESTQEWGRLLAAPTTGRVPLAEQRSPV